MIGNYVLIRTYSAGVFVGVLRSRDGDEATLDQCRRIWRWYGAHTCSEIATTGLDSGRSRVSVPVDGHMVRGVIEIIPMSDAARATIAAAGWAT